jgi:hypothetical protein
MSYVLATILSTDLMLGVSSGAEKVELKDQKDKETFRLGYQFGQNLKAQRLDINLDVYAAGIKAALRGTNPLLTQKKLNRTVLKLRQKVAAARQKGLKEKAGL